ncbi:hypothetical protein [Agaricicola taiwanensis]|nr:hypothetical protein [Agaricicola taiwanensis]
MSTFLSKSALPVAAFIAAVAASSAYAGEGGPTQRDTLHTAPQAVTYSAPVYEGRASTGGAGWIAQNGDAAVQILDEKLAASDAS